MSLVLGTIEDVYVYNNKADDATKTYNPHCMWCEREFELSNSDDAICSMYETVDAGYQWTGEYIHRECDLERSNATMEEVERLRKETQVLRLKKKLKIEMRVK